MKGPSRPIAGTMGRNRPGSLSADDTIAAVSTPVGQGGIGIIRVSGPLSLPIARRVFQPRRPIRAFQSHRLYLGIFREPATGAILDEVLLSFMKGPHSYTREDLIEINSHSGYYLLSRLLQCVLDEGARLARPGEFTLRAFLNGRIDLTQAEAVVDLINACSEKGVKLATSQIRGGFRRELDDLRRKAVELLARMEAAIDFPEEENRFPIDDEAASEIDSSLVRPIEATLAARIKDRTWVDGVKTVIAGRVNAGKSSLLNRLLDEQRAIVTPIPGTTRDAIESTLTLGGVPLRLIDTAGLREVDDEVERIGIRVTERKVAEADFLLVVIDRSRPLAPDDLKLLGEAGRMNALAVLNKIDLPSCVDAEELEQALAGIPCVRISALTGEGLDELKQRIVDCVLGGQENTVTARMASRVRFGRALSDAVRCFKAASEHVRKGSPVEIAALELKSGLDAVGEIVGETTTEEVLESIFSQFCLGK